MISGVRVLAHPLVHQQPQNTFRAPSVSDRMDSIGQELSGKCISAHHNAADEDQHHPSSSRERGPHSFTAFAPCSDTLEFGGQGPWGGFGVPMISTTTGDLAGSV